MRDPADQKWLIERIREYQAVHSELEAEGDRSAAIVGAAYLDAQLELLLRRAFVSDEVCDRLFEQNQPLGSFGAKVDIAYAIGLISADVRHDLHLLRKIRNDFAHKVSAKSLSASPMREHCHNLALKRAVSEEELTKHPDIERRLHRQAVNSIRQEFIEQALRRQPTNRAESLSSVYRLVARGEKLNVGNSRPYPS